MSEERTYDWNGHKDMLIRYPDWSDKEMASQIRMLMRSDLFHEAVVCAARDRIMCLSKEKEQLEQQLKNVRECLDYNKHYDPEMIEQIRVILKVANG